MRMYAEISLNKPVAGKRPMEDHAAVNFVFPMDYYIEQCAQALLLTHSELHLVMLRSVMPIEAFRVLCVHRRQKLVKRQRPHVSYMHKRHEIFIVTCGFILGIGRKHKIGAI